MDEKKPFNGIIEDIEDVLRRGDHVQALQRLDDLMTLRPSDPRVLTLAAHVNVLNGNLETALSYAGRAATSDGGDVKAKFVLGFCLHNLGEHETAAKVYDDIVALVPTSAVAHVFRAEALSKSGRVDDAIEAYRQALELDRDGDVGSIAEEMILRLKEGQGPG